MDYIIILIEYNMKVYIMQYNYKYSYINLL